MRRRAAVVLVALMFVAGCGESGRWKEHSIDTVTSS